MLYNQTMKWAYPLVLLLIAMKSSAIAGNVVPMAIWNLNSCDDDVMNLYLYEKGKNIFHILKENCNDINTFGNLNPNATLFVHGEELDSGENVAVVYDVAIKKNTTLHPSGGMSDPSAAFSESGKILFVGMDGALKQMDVDGGNISSIAKAEAPYSFNDATFWISPDRRKLLITENRIPCNIYEKCNFQRVIMLDLVTLERTLITEEYLGDWNICNWRSDSRSFYYVYHEFLPDGGRKYRTITVDVDCENGISKTDLTTSDLATQAGSDHNICVYTQSNNLLSLLDQGLYLAKTGALVARKADVPMISQAPKLFGFNEEGIYFADPDGSNFVTFTETPIVLGDFDGNGKIDLKEAIHALQTVAGQ